MTDEWYGLQLRPLGVKKARKLLSGIGVTRLDDGSWIWAQIRGQAVAVFDPFGRLTIFLMWRDGQFVLADANEATHAAVLTGAAAKALHSEALQLSARPRPPIAEASTAGDEPMPGHGPMLDDGDGDLYR